MLANKGYGDDEIQQSSLGFQKDNIPLSIHNKSVSPSPRIQPKTASDDGSQIDIMIVYTPAARREAGGDEKMEEAIRIAIDNTNQIFEQSKIPTRLRLVYQQEVSYVEKLWYDKNKKKWLVDDHADRRSLLEKSDGEMDEIHPLRDLFGADLVCLLNTGAGSSAYSQPFFVAQWKGARDGDVFQHEMGHCFGCAHAVGDTWSGNPPGCEKGAGKYPYSHGWHLFIGDQRYSTIMAYHTPDYRFSTSSIKIRYYSNPDVLYQGVPTGRPLGEGDEANNALTITNMAYTVANWRTAVTSPDPPQNVEATQGTSGEVTITWNKVMNGTHYRLFRSEQETEYPSPLSPWQNFPTAVFQDTNCEPFKTYYYYVKAAKSIHGSLPSDLSEPSVGWRKLPPPASIQASDGTTFGYIQVIWSKVDNATHYRIWRSESKDREKALTSAWQSQTELKDYAVQPLKPYYYWVQSANNAQGTLPSNFSDSDSGWSDLNPPLLTASDGAFTDRVHLEWKASDGAPYYCIYRSESETGKKIAVSAWQTSLSFNDTTALPGRIYYYWLRCATNSSGFDGTDYGAPDRGWRILETPSGLKASDGTSSQSIKISWNTIEGSVRYRVFRKDSSSGTAAAIGTWLTQTEYEDVTVQPGQLYYYSVKALSQLEESLETPFSNTDEGWRSLLSPTGVKAADGVSPVEIRVEWNGVWGANFYRLYRANNWKGDNKITITGWIFPRFFVDKQVSSGENYYYWVAAAVDAQGNHASALSLTEAGSAGLIPPENIVASKGSNFVTVTWNAASGAKFYRVFRSSSVDGEKTPLGDWIQQLKYEDRSIALGIVFYYWVKASETSVGANASAFSTFDAGYRSLPAPKGLNVSEGDFLDFIHISWDPVGEATHYRVFRTDEPNGVKIAVTGWQTDPEFHDPNTTPGHIYYYYIRAAGDANGKGSSEYSSVKGGFRSHPAPKNVLASNGVSTEKIIVTWSPIPNVVYYQVFRSETKDGTKLRLADFDRIARYEDTTAKIGTVYYYWVKAALGMSGYGSTDFSEPDAGWKSPPVPTGLQASDADYLDKIVVTWNLSAENAFYHVSRREGTGGEMVDVGEWQTDIHYEDSNVKPGITYYYWVRAANNNKGDGASDFSNVNGGLRALDPPGGVGALQGSDSDKIAVWWNPTEGATFYQVYRAETDEGERMPITGWQRAIRIEDPNVTIGKVYRYWVRAAMGWTGFAASDYSKIVTGWMKPPTPQSIIASDGDFEDKIQVKWDYPLPDFYYRIFRSESIDGEKTALGSWQKVNVFDDTTATPNLTYYYWVLASTDSIGIGPSENSMDDTGWRKPPVPGTPLAFQPGNGSLSVSVQAKFDWSDCVFVDSYDLLIWKEGEIETTDLVGIITESPPELPTKNLKESAYQPTDLLEYQTTYHWQVIAKNRNTSVPSVIWSFTTEKSLSVKSWSIY